MSLAEWRQDVAAEKTHLGYPAWVKYKRAHDRTLRNWEVRMSRTVEGRTVVRAATIEQARIEVARLVPSDINWYNTAQDPIEVLSIEKEEAPF